MQAHNSTTTNHSEHGLLTREETWKRIRCSPRHLANMVKDGRLPYIKIGKLIRFLPADVDALIARHRVGG
jgi:excisionase family DNA binding protein